MTLIEEREAFEPRILGGKQRLSELEPSPYDESSSGGSDDEYLIANEDIHEENNNRDFFSLPTIGLNYLNNLNLSLNLNLNLRNSSFWKLYENSSFPKTGFLSNYLGKHPHHDLDNVDGDEHSLINHPDDESRGYFPLANFIRHAFHQSYEEEFSDEALLERVRINQSLWANSQRAQQQQLEEKSSFTLSDLHLRDRKRRVISDSDLSCTESIEDKQTNRRVEAVDDIEIEEPFNTEVEERIKLEEKGDRVSAEVEICNTENSKEKDMSQNKALKRCPFYNRAELSFWNKVKIGLFTVILLPVKLICMILTLLLALLVVCLGMLGTTPEDIENKPLSSWRKGFRYVLANIVMRSFVFSSGFIWSIKETGKRASPEEAPIFAVAPHSSYFDAFAVILMGAPSVVARMSTKDVPIFGRMVTFTQAVYVSRESKENRKQTMENLKERARGVYEGNGMPQIFIFPEGTCSNRSSLIKFKVGAFAPGVPVQPVLIRYPNQFDSITWTFDGPSAYRNIWYALALPFNRIEIEYLPVYVPSEAEKNDSALYADNVRRVMSEALGIPTCDYQFEDGTLICKMRQDGLVKKLKAIHRAKKALGLNRSQVESAMIHANTFRRIEFNYEFQRFQKEFFLVNDADTVIPEVQVVFNSFKEPEEDEIDIRPYLILTCVLYPEKGLDIEEMPKRICELLHNSEEITQSTVKKIMEYVFHGKTDSSADTTKKSGTSSSAIQEDVPLSPDVISQQMSRHLEFTKLFGDEVAERLPATYPRRSERDRPQRRQKAD